MARRWETPWRVCLSQATQTFDFKGKKKEQRELRQLACECDMAT